MKNYKIKKLAIATSALILISGCQMLRKPATSASKKINPPSKKIKKTVKVSPNSILENILQGINDNSYNDFSNRFNEKLKQQLTKEKFIKLKNGIETTLGKYQNRTYLGSLQKGPFTIYIWKSRFSKLKDTDMVIYLTLGKPDRKIEVFDFTISNS